MKVMVTGANGFIGKHVVRNLLSKNCDVIALVRDFESMVEFQKFSPKLKLFRVDVSNPIDDIYQQCERPEALIHLAWGGLPAYNSLHHFEIELPTQYRFLKAIVSQGLPNLIVAGTCFEYGMQCGRLSEDFATSSKNAYGFAKSTLFQQLEYLQKLQEFNLVWARLFFTYGEGQASTSLIPSLKNAIRTGEAQFNLSGGEQIRDFLPVELVADYLVKLTMKTRNIGVVNVCSGIPISVRSLTESIVKDANSAIKLNFGYYKYTDYEPMEFWGDDRLLKSHLYSA